MWVGNRVVECKWVWIQAWIGGYNEKELQHILEQPIAAGEYVVFPLDPTIGLGVGPTPRTIPWYHGTGRRSTLSWYQGF